MDKLISLGPKYFVLYLFKCHKFFCDSYAHILLSPWPNKDIKNLTLLT